VEVVLLTQPHCAFCDDARQLLDRLAGEYDLTVREVDVASPEGQAVAREQAILFPPGIVVDGEGVAYGRPSERRLRRELDRRASRRR
jgi:glutaredoxin